MGSANRHHFRGAFVADSAAECVRMQRLVTELHADPAAYMVEQQSLAEALLETLEEERRYV
eukprot:494775-Prorocentrum_minimum.AAC.1